MPGFLIVLVRNWRAIGAAALIAAIVALALVDATHVRQRNEARAGWAGEQAAHRRTVDIYTAAAAVAAKRDAENVARVSAAQHAITERITDDFQDRLADSNARYQRLHDQAEAYSRGAGTADVSAARDATCRAYANTSCDRLPGLLKAAQDNTDQLVGLIAWAQAQAAVPVSDETAK